MKFTPIEPPRPFMVGPDRAITLEDCAHIELQPNEQVTFVTETGVEYDVVRKTWGFYATPSLNGRLRAFGLKTALARSVASGRYYILLVEARQQPEFESYLQTNGMGLVEWLDERTE